MMKMVFVSNILSHHLIELCDEFYRLVDDFKFVASEIDYVQGYQSSNKAKYVVDYSVDKQLCEKVVIDADVVIFGSCPNELIERRMEFNKLSFLYSERFFKKGIWRRFIPRTRNAVMQRVGKYRDKNMYVLCASAFLPYDLSLVGFPVEKCFKWGYFPEIKKYDTRRLLAGKQSCPIRILWTGRMLGWKHPELAIELAKRLSHDGYDFELVMIGDGERKQEIIESVRKKGLGQRVRLIGSMKPEEVRKEMEKSDIFLTTSDYYEGWGAVLNEAMNSGCAVVASHAAGSTPYLVEDSVNGMIFESENIEDLYWKVKMLLDNNEKRKSISTAAYETIRDIWNTTVAVERFLKLTEVLLVEEKNVPLYGSGPCSNVEILKNRWYEQ